MAQTLLTIVSLWGAIGLAVTGLFLAWGIDRVDEDARGAYLARILFIPGIILLWPLVVWRWVTLEVGAARWQARHSPSRSAHIWVWLVMAVLIPTILIAAYWVDQEWPAAYAPQQILQPEAEP